MPTASRHVAHLPNRPSLPAGAAIFASLSTRSSAPHAGRRRHPRILSWGVAIVVGTLVGLVSGLLLLAAFFTLYLSI